MAGRKSTPASPGGSGGGHQGDPAARAYAQDLAHWLERQVYQHGPRLNALLAEPHPSLEELLEAHHRASLLQALHGVAYVVTQQEGQQRIAAERMRDVQALGRAIHARAEGGTADGR